MTVTAAPSARVSRRTLSVPYLRWGFLALLQLALISIPLADRLHVQLTGTTVQLELVPVDPRDLLRGDFVIINLAAARISATVPGSTSVKTGQRVFVSFSGEADGPARPVAVAAERQDAGPLAIAGTVRSVAKDHIRISYGIGAFFVAEGEGRILERLDTSRLLLDVSVAEDGRSLPVALLVDGKVFRSDSIF